MSRDFAHIIQNCQLYYQVPSTSLICKSYSEALFIWILIRDHFHANRNWRVRELCTTLYYTRCTKSEIYPDRSKCFEICWFKIRCILLQNNNIRQNSDVVLISITKSHNKYWLLRTIACFILNYYSYYLNCTIVTL